MLQGQIDAARMIAMNGEAKLNKIPESRVASEFLHIQLHIDTHSDEQSMTDILLLRTREHLLLVGISLAASILISIPMGCACVYQTAAGAADSGSACSDFTPFHRWRCWCL